MIQHFVIIKHFILHSVLFKPCYHSILFSSFSFQKPWAKFFGAGKPKRRKQNPNNFRKKGPKPPRPTIESSRNDGITQAYENIFQTSPSPNLEPPPPPHTTSSVPSPPTNIETFSPFNEKPSTSSGDASYSSVYFETPSPTDKIDDHIEVYELNISPHDTYEDNNNVHDRSDDNHDILKDYYVGEDNLSRTPSRRPNSYFYDEASDGEMKESVNQIRKATTPNDWNDQAPIYQKTTPLPLLDDPLPTYKSYIEQTSTTASTTTTATTKTTTTTQPSTTESQKYYPTTYTPKLQRGKSSTKQSFTNEPQEYRVYPATFTPKSKFQPAKSSTKPNFTTFRPFFKQGSTTKIPFTPFTTTTRPYRKSAANSFRSGTTISPSRNPIHQVTTSYDSPLIPNQSPSVENGNKYDPNMFEEELPDDNKYIATPKYHSKIFQQIGNQVSVNITTPSEKSWEKVVTMTPSLRRDEDTFQDSAPISISTTQQPSLNYISTPTWSRKDEETTAASWQAKQEQESKPTKKSFSLIPKVTPLNGFLSTPNHRTTPKTNLLMNSGIQWGSFKPKTNLSSKRNWQKRKPYTKKRNTVTLKPKWAKRRTTLAPSKDIFPGDSFKTTRNPALKSSPQTFFKNKIRSTYSPRKQVTTTTATKAPNLDIGKALDKIISTSTFISTAKPRSYVSSNNNIWTATKKPPPPKVTTPGWHIHTNADMTTPNIERSDNSPTEHTPTKTSYKNNLSTMFPKKISISKKARNNIFQKIKQLAPRIKASRKTEGKSYSKPNVKIYKFTAEEAVEKAPARSSKLSFESQKLESDTRTADSRSHITVTKYNPENTRTEVNRFPSQVSDWVPVKSSRRSDDESLPSYKITPDIVKGGYKISPVKRTEPGTWLLRSPDGTEFHFKSLKQIYDLNQNNFVPG